jgi:phospholipid-binding lipoprotein MlaA
MTSDVHSKRLGHLACGILLGAVALLSGCAATSPDPRDPLEGINRGTYKFNDALDKAVLKPVAQGYNAVLPQPVRNCVGNIFGNLGDLYTGVNNLIEGYPHDAGSDVCRVAVNTTVGVLGCFDVASGMGFTKHKKDFGITLGVWGVSPGPYIVLPLFGPSDVRDTGGLVVDLYADPVGYLYPVWQRNTLEGIRLIDTRASLLGAGNLLQGAALDEYVFVRDGWFTRRRSQIYNGNPPDDAEPDADTPATNPQQGTKPAAPAPESK